MRIGKSSYIFNHSYLESSRVVVGPLEGEGPLTKYFDKIVDSNKSNQKSWEKAELQMSKMALGLLRNWKTVDLALGGDLNNQSTLIHYLLRNEEIPCFSIYGACSNFSLSFILSSILLEDMKKTRILSMISSHHGQAEKQFRTPNEYGGYKPETATFTATASVASILTNQFDLIQITGGTIGNVIDVGYKDSLDLGTCMAFAAIDTIEQHFKDFHRTSEDYDMIFTGDLSYYGSKIVKTHFQEKGILFENYEDCGNMIYEKKSKIKSGGSGCGCVAAVSMGYLKNMLLQNRFKRILIVSTGALHNPIHLLQKETIPCVAHAIVLERRNLV